MRTRAPARRGALQVQRRGPQPNTVYELNKDVLTLGRDIANEIVINDAEVSRMSAPSGNTGRSCEARIIAL